MGPRRRAGVGQVGRIFLSSGRLVGVGVTAVSSFSAFACTDFGHPSQFWRLPLFMLGLRFDAGLRQWQRSPSLAEVK